MTQTTVTLPEPSAVSQAVPLHPSDILMNIIIMLLAPMFLCATAGNIYLARLAAAETIKDYRARNNTDLMAIAQIIACGLATLSLLGLSMADDLPLSITLRLRSNAVGLSRIADQNRRRLKEPAKANPPVHTIRELAPAVPEPPASNADQIPSAPQPEPIKIQASAILPKPSPQSPTIAAAIETLKSWQPKPTRSRSAAKLDVAGQVSAAVANLAAAERKPGQMWTTTLSSTTSRLIPRLDGPPLKPIIRGLSQHTV